MNIAEIAKAAKQASIHLAATKTELRNRALAVIVAALKNRADNIVRANQKDLARSEKDGLAVALLKRLKFDAGKVNEVCAGLESLIKLSDPVGRTIDAVELDAGLELYKVSCPIGVIGVVFESRPDALVQISALCLKSGNAVLLKGGSEAVHTNRILAEIITQATESCEIPAGWLGLLETRADVAGMLSMDEYIDLIVPRGSNEFVRHIMNNTNIPVLGHADGICHVYVDAEAQLDMALDIVVDAKCQYCAVCNAMETLLVHRDVAKDFLPMVKDALEAKNVQLRGCAETVKIIDVAPAGEQDWRTEYLDYILSIKVVNSLGEAIEHINRFGSSHTDAIVTANKANAAKFMDLVDSANVFVNCSTRFSDGYRFGLGAEVGISTNKIHARGPVGLEGLLIYKWRLVGSGQVVADYCGEEAKKFTHKKLDKGFDL
jgi:glutamate-5-semialdehyde dehydrogenase